MKQTIKILSLLLVLTTIAACGTSVKTPTETEFETACKNFDVESFQHEENGLIAYGNDWSAHYLHCSSLETAIATFQDAADTANLNTADTGDVDSHNGDYQTFMKQTTLQFLYVAQIRDVYIFAQGTPECEQTISDLMATLGIE